MAVFSAILKILIIVALCWCVYLWYAIDSYKIYDPEDWNDTEL